MKLLLPIILLLSLVAPAKAGGLICQETASTEFFTIDGELKWRTSKLRQHIVDLEDYPTIYFLSDGGLKRHNKYSCETKAIERIGVECISEAEFMNTPDNGTTHLFYLRNDLKRFQYIIPSERAYLEGDMGNVRVAIGDCEEY